MKKIVIIGGGTGTSTLLKGLKKYNTDLSVIVSTADDGGSTGELRKSLGVLPPGDMRQCLAALSDSPKLSENFTHRFSFGPLKGHSLGNIILANLEKRYGINKALDILSKALKVKGSVIPVTLKPTLLSAVLENGKTVVGEHNIDEPNFKLKISNIKSLQLAPSGPANPKALEVLKNADVIIFGPGDLFTSTLPNFLVKGITSAVNSSKAKKIFITNIMTKFGQTDSFKASDFVKVLEQYLKGKIDFALVNNQKPDKKATKAYAKQKSKFVVPNIIELSKTGTQTIAADLLAEQMFKKKPADKLQRSLLRHDAEKLSKLIWNLI